MTEDARKLTLYLRESDRGPGGRLVADALFDLFERSALRVSVLVRGVEGFGRSGLVESERLETLAVDLPLVAVAVDRPQRIEQVLEEVRGLMSGGVVTVERARLVTDAMPAPEPAGPAAKLTVYCGRAERTAGGSAARAVIEHARMHGATAGSVLLGLDGTVHGVRRRARFASSNADVPLMVIVVGPDGAIAAARAGIVEMLDDPVVTLERVAIGAPPPTPADESVGSQWWQKLMVHCGADASSDGRPLHLAVLDAIRAGGLAGATSLRGNWGFAAGSRPHGDSARALRRRTPVLTVAIDRPRAVERAWPALESLVAGAGVLTREWVPVVDSRPSAWP